MMAVLGPRASAGPAAALFAACALADAQGCAISCRMMSRGFPAFVLLASAIVLGTALASQYLGGLMPCELCLAERWPWAAAIVSAFVAMVIGNRPALPWVAALLALVFAASSALAFYHVGVEQHWFAGPAACTAPASPADTVAALEAQLLHQQPVPCDQPAWSLFGVSLAGWNLVASFIMLLCCLAAALWSRTHRRRPAVRSVI
jgi:disulfide bond formation protein DsbB